MGCEGKGAGVKTDRFSVALLIFGIGAGVVSADGERISGWRGDGTGRDPQAAPVTTWGRVAKSVKALSAQAGRPKAADALPTADQAIPDGVIRRWLVLVVPAPEGRKITDELLPNEAASRPEENEKVGDASWKALTLDSSCLDLSAFLPPPAVTSKVAAYAQANVYSPGGEPVFMNLMYEAMTTCWLNGKTLFTHQQGGNSAARVRLPLAKGWNSLLFKTVSGTDRSRAWYLRPVLFGAEPGEYETKNIVWTTLLPASGCSAPVIVGGRLFVTAESGALCCAGKEDGRLLWVRTSTYYDTATPAERETNAQAFTELDTLAARLKELDKAAAEAAAPEAEKTFAERRKVEDQLNKGMGKIDRKYALAPLGEAGFTGPALVTDGRDLFVAFGSGVVVCYDMEGNRKWASLESHPMLEHGYNSSPLLVDGKLVVYMGDLRALDARTGKVAWERPRFLPEPSRTYYHFHGTGGVFSDGDAKVAFFPNGEFVRLSDGKTLFANFFKFGDSRTASPVVDGGVAYKIASTAGGVIAIKPGPITDDKLRPEIVKTVKFDVAKFPRFYQGGYNASPLLHEGLLYCLNEDGVLTVVDVEKSEVVYQRMTDLDLYMHHNFACGRGGASASPALGGKYIFLFGNQGAALVLEPGRVYKPIAKNRIEQVTGRGEYWARQEITMTCPVFEGSRLYYRAERHLYCIGER